MPPRTFLSLIGPFFFPGVHRLFHCVADRTSARSYMFVPGKAYFARQLMLLNSTCYRLPVTQSLLILRS